MKIKYECKPIDFNYEDWKPGDVVVACTPVDEDEEDFVMCEVAEGEHYTIKECFFISDKDDTAYNNWIVNVGKSVNFYARSFHRCGISKSIKNNQPY